jgi:hypothetical protein
VASVVLTSAYVATPATKNTTPAMMTRTDGTRDLTRLPLLALQRSFCTAGKTPYRAAQGAKL